jgi:GT2 family glycosyltransferase
LTTGTTPLIATIIPNWNGKELLRLALESLLLDGYPDQMVIVIDNGSTDGSREMMRDDYPDVVLISNVRNRGFARANNQGIEAALRSGADFCFFLNNDATVEPGCLGTLIDAMAAEPDVGAVAPLIVYADHPDLIWYGGGVVSLRTGYIGHRFIRKPRNAGDLESGATDYLTGCALMVRSDVLRQVGGFDTSYPLYCEDVDLSLNILKAGKRITFWKDGVVRHKVSSSSGGGISPLKAYHRGRSTALLLKRWAPGSAWLTLTFTGTLGLAASSLKLIFSGKVIASSALIRGVIGGMLNLNQPECYRLEFDGE